MIVDAETLDLSNSIESAPRDLERYRRGRGQARADGVGLRDRHRRRAATRREAGAQLRELRRRVQSNRRAHGLAIGSAGTHPFAMWEDQRIVARPRYRDLIAGPAVRGAPGADLRHPRARGRRRPRQGHPRGQRDARPPAGAARPVGELAVLARRQDRAAVHAHADLPAFPRVGIPPRYEDWDRLGAADRVHGRVARDRGLHLPLVRRPPAPELRHGRDPRDGRPDPRGAHARRWRRWSRRWSRSCASTTTQGRSSPATRTRCSTRTSGWPRATGSRASSSTCRHRPRADPSWPGG